MLTTLLFASKIKICFESKKAIRGEFDYHKANKEALTALCSVAKHARKKRQEHERSVG